MSGLLRVAAGTPAACTTAKGAALLVAVSLAGTALALAIAAETETVGVTGDDPPEPPPQPDQSEYHDTRPDSMETRELLILISDTSFSNNNTVCVCIVYLLLPLRNPPRIYLVTGLGFARGRRRRRTPSATVIGSEMRFG